MAVQVARKTEIPTPNRSAPFPLFPLTLLPEITKHHFPFNALKSPFNPHFSQLGSAGTNSTISAYNDYSRTHPYALLRS